MSLTPRDYQIDALAGVRAGLGAGKRVLLVAPTGAGKTVIAAWMVNGLVKKAHKVLFLAHRKELIDQSSNKLKTLGIPHGVIMADDPRAALHHDVQVASIQTLTRREVPFRPTVIIVDEAHRARAKGYEDTFQRWPHAAVIGLTATPVRSDDKGLGELFGHLTMCPSLAQLTEMGHLVPAECYSKKIDLSGIKTSKGDYDTTQLEARMNQPVLVGDVVGHWKKLAADRITVGFAITVAHSQALVKEFQAAGVAAEHLDGETPKWRREALLARLKRGQIRVLWNVGVLTEGWDCPEVSAIILARPTKSLGLYLQMVGRALRPSPGKTDCVILDHAGSCYSHGLPADEREWTLDPDEMKKRVKKAREKREKQVSICPNCARVRGEEPKCMGCGFEFGIKPQHVDGELEKVQKRPPLNLTPEQLEERRQYFFRMLDIQAEKGYKPGFAAMRYNGKFPGEWPKSQWRERWKEVSRPVTPQDHHQPFFWEPDLVDPAPSVDRSAI